MKSGIVGERRNFDTLISLLCCPQTREELTFHRLSEPDAPKLDGLLISSSAGFIYPIVSDVPIMLPRAVPADFARHYGSKIDQLGIDILRHIDRDARKWSFSDQWRTFQELGVEETWGLSTKARVEMFFQETERTPEELKDLVVLDAGCGNGLLTEALGRNAKIVIGMDFSDSVYNNAKRNTTANVFFLRGDIQKPPFKEEKIDVIVSNGVLHHTPNTRRSFEALVPSVKPGGSYYIWLYRHSQQGNIFRRVLRHTAVGLRSIVSPLPPMLRWPFVHAFAVGLMFWTKVNGRGKSYPYKELVIGSLDSITPKYRTMHTPTEVAEWYFESGFGPLTLTHWDNRSGFGVVARKQPLDCTPGENYSVPRGSSVLRYGL